MKPPLPMPEACYLPRLVVQGCAAAPFCHIGAESHLFWRNQRREGCRVEEGSRYLPQQHHAKFKMQNAKCERRKAKAKGEKQKGDENVGQYCAIGADRAGGHPITLLGPAVRVPKVR